MKKYIKLLVFYSVMLLATNSVLFITIFTGEINGIWDFFGALVVLGIAGGLLVMTILIQIIIKLFCIVLQIIAICIKKEKVKSALTRYRLWQI